MLSDLKQTLSECYALSPICLICINFVIFGLYNLDNADFNCQKCRLTDKNGIFGWDFPDYGVVFKMGTTEMQSVDDKMGVKLPFIIRLVFLRLAEEWAKFYFYQNFLVFLQAENGQKFGINQ